MPLYQFIILLVFIMLFGGFACFLLIKLVMLRKADAKKTADAVQYGIDNALAGFESRLAIKTDAVATEHSRDIEQLRSALSDSMTVRFDSFGRLISGQTDALSNSINQRQSALERSLFESSDHLGRQLSTQQQALQTNVTEQLAGMSRLIDTQNKRNDERLNSFASANAAQLQSVDKSLVDFREVVERQLDSIRGVVNEKLQQTLNERFSESFKRVDERLAEVYKGLGEMQALASGVGDLKKVLSNVKTRGTLGEIQLRAILEEVLAPEQYEMNFDAGKGTSQRVEFAIKLPNDGKSAVYLPIDSKFPADMYLRLTDAYESGNPAAVEAAQRALREALMRFAKDIFDKYINPPRTTNFAVMFLPTEGLYAEAVRLGLIETLQAKYRINIAGPSTMAALLNSLQMGFRTLAIQKRSGEVWEILARIKKEFNTFDDVLSNTRRALLKANDDLDKLVGVRTRQIRKALDKVEELPLPADGAPSLPPLSAVVAAGEDTDDFD